MKTLYCPECGKETGHKRSLGFGTVFAVIVTGGLWLLAILAYPSRCVVCGNAGGVGPLEYYLFWRKSIETDEAKLAENLDLDQAWVEEFIYKFNKVVTNISSNPGNPINDYGVVSSFFDTIKEKSLDTSRIRGLENKTVFEQTLLKAQQLIEGLEEKPGLQNYLRQQEEAPLKQERLRAEEDAKAAPFARRRRTVNWLMLGAYALAAIVFLTYEYYQFLAIVTVVEGIIFLYLDNKLRKMERSGQQYN